MSNYCRGCRFDRTVRSGENAYPFNFFYWDLVARHRDKLQSIGRMGFIDRQSRQNAAGRIGNHPAKSGRVALRKSVVSCQLSVVSCQQSAVSSQQSLVICYLLFATNAPCPMPHAHAPCPLQFLFFP